jgi:diphthamide synthase (EF-2-diphthine--ammonia ligase)
MTTLFETGHKALVTGINKEKLNAEYLALEFNQTYLDKLPKDINIAGANGEYRTFVIYGPGFKTRLSYSKSIAIDEGDFLVSLIKEP